MPAQQSARLPQRLPTPLKRHRLTLLEMHWLALLQQQHGLPPVRRHQPQPVPVLVLNGLHGAALRLVPVLVLTTLPGEALWPVPVLVLTALPGEALWPVPVLVLSGGR